MDAIELLKNQFAFFRQVTLQYVDDLTEAEWLIRPVPSANHTAWQVGHLIASEREMMSALGHDMPALPEGFAEKHTKETAGNDAPAGFLSKSEYIELMKQMRAATLAAIAKTAPAELDQPAPEAMRSYASTVGDVLSIVGTHEVMHLGQFAVLRRKLGKPFLF